ncbi:MAG TPA: DNA polymerase III subunit epsilon [Casimicrobiaceae bacterium]|nr:DNA polymerase III subunit epsilon [Casimicrobiaceae bacterium]
MRQVILDTETTGLDPARDRVIEVAAIEIVDRRPTGRNIHYYVDPEQEIDRAASEVHGLTWDDLKGKPRFADVAAELLDFLRGAEWIIHNAPFDVAFLDKEMAHCGHAGCASVYAKVTDTLALAREQFPGKRNGLDALCERFGVDNAQRSLHGALLDARLLADVYLAMTRGQESLTIDMGETTAAAVTAAAFAFSGRPRVALVVLAPSDDELAAHRNYLDALERESKAGCMWLSLANVAAA